jgi:hypothetical protein
MDFYFPTQELKLPDYEPVQVVALKEYYKTYFISMLDKVNYILFILFR